MNVLSTSLVLVLSAPGLAWIETRRRRILPPAEEIISRLHDGELKSIEEVAPNNNADDVLKTDQQFWKRSGGYPGLLRKQENAVCFVQLTQCYVRDSKMDKEDADYFSERAFYIVWLNRLSVMEGPLRFFRPSMPHFCAKWACHFYWEAATQMQMLHLEYGSGKLSL